MLATGVLVPSFNNDRAVEIQAVVRDLVSGVRYARNHAVSRQRESTFVMDIDARNFEVPGTGFKRGFPADVDVTLYTVRSELNDGHIGAIRFFPDGTSTGGRITVTASGRQSTYIDVDWLTGRVNVL